MLSVLKLNCVASASIWPLTPALFQSACCSCEVGLATSKLTATRCRSRRRSRDATNKTPRARSMKRTAGKRFSASSHSTRSALAANKPSRSQRRSSDSTSRASFGRTSAASAYRFKPTAAEPAAATTRFAPASLPHNCITGSPALPASHNTAAICSATVRCDATSSFGAGMGSTIPARRSSKCVTPVKKCSTRSSIFNVLCVMLEPGCSSIQRQRRSGASGRNALQ